LNYASEEETYQALAAVNNLEFIDPAALDLNKTILQSIPVKLVLHYHLVPIHQEAGILTVACSEIPPLSEQGNLRLLLAKRIKFVIATPSSIHAVIKKHYGLGADTIQQLRQDRGIRQTAHEVVFDLKAAEANPNVEASIKDFVDQILLEALRLDATDIHFEPYPNTVRLRYRVDGILQEIPVPSDLRQVYDYIVSRIKVMAGLDIAERRLPHDGRIAMKTAAEEYAVRVSIIPTKYGESVCLRLLGRQNLFLDLAQLGMDPEQQATVEKLTQLPQGMILITGPTGSGKTTTLYAALAHANDVGRKIITIENPVEYQLEGVAQIQTHEEIGLTFSSGLRSVLRHDPDVVLIGEIRDPETAEIAIRAAQTGHLVFSTLHTNDSISAITRLIEMGIEPFLVGSSLVCSIAQRLARRVCRHCRQPDPDIPPKIRLEMAQALGLAPDSVQAWFGKGCVECNQNGYRGRVALYEFFIINDEICDMLNQAVTTSQLRQAAVRFGWHPLRTYGWSKIQSGLISVAEHQRLTLRISDFVLAKPAEP
jgi:general secretion pathway protein E/type IV pilus assembly protein PilB